MRKSLFFLAVVTMLAGSAQADDATVHSVAIGGSGREPCSSWTKDRSGDSEQAKKGAEIRLEWILGFFSAVNLFDDPSGDLHGGIDDREGLIAGIDNQCRSHPDDPLFAAAANLVLELKNHPKK
jgi:hypothetical protein